MGVVDLKARVSKIEQQNNISKLSGFNELQLSTAILKTKYCDPIPNDSKKVIKAFISSLGIKALNIWAKRLINRQLDLTMINKVDLEEEEELIDR